jgi:DNA-binding transcriptional ArsR family regulator
MTNVSTDQPPYVAYPSRGSATVWDDDATTRSDAAAGAAAGDTLAALVGRGRAAVLRGLDAPRTPTELAARLGVTPSAVSQHLRVLAGARTVDRIRRGRRVTYRRTPFGDDLLGATAPLRASADRQGAAGSAISR